MLMSAVRKGGADVASVDELTEAGSSAARSLQQGVDLCRRIPLGRGGLLVLVGDVGRGFDCLTGFEFPAKVLGARVGQRLALLVALGCALASVRPTLHAA